MKILLTGNTAFKLANFREGLIRRLIAQDHELTALVPFDENVDKLRGFGCEVIELPMNRKGASIPVELQLLRRFYSEFKTRKPDIVFGYTIKNNIYGALAARWLGIPFIPNVTGLGTAFDTTGLLNKTVVTLYRQAFKRVPVVFFQNTHDRDLFIQARIVRNNQTEMLPGSGVDLDRFQQSPLPGADDAPIFILIARMLRDKGIAEFVAASKTVSRTYPKARFQLLGPLDYDSRAAINEATLSEWQADGAIEYLGAVEDVRPAIVAADCVVLPSYYREGTPRALLEAAAMGRPIITTDMPGCRDTVDHGASGFICPPRDTAALAHALCQMIEVKSKGRQTLGDAGRVKAETQFNEELVISAYVGIISGLSS